MSTEKAFPKVYTLTSTKAIRYWEVKVVIEETGEINIYRTFGQLNGKAQVNKLLITETRSKSTLLEQALFEAESYWKEIVEKKGYVIDINSLGSTVSQLTQLSQPSIEIVKPKVAIKLKSEKLEIPFKIENKETLKLKSKSLKIGLKSGEFKGGESKGGEFESVQAFKFLPMLANKYTERKSYVKYPCVTQDKLDGVRCTARKISVSEVSLRTRNDKEYPFFSEVKDALLKLLTDSNVFIDGEFYSQLIPFRTLNGYCNRKKLDGKTGWNSIPKDHLESIHYCIFDCYFIDAPNRTFSERYKYLEVLLSNNTNPYLKLVSCRPVNNETDIMNNHTQSVTEGYEGVIVRNFSGVYKLKDRSNDLLKYKEFVDSEFLIVGAECPSNGKEEGCLIWELGVPGTELTFKCRPREPYESRKQSWIDYQEDPSIYIGQQYTVRYQEKYETGVPRFPVGIAIRDDI
jgi:hypothetical protein